jgi:hypothetical protein
MSRTSDRTCVRAIACDSASAPRRRLTSRSDVKAAAPLAEAKWAARLATRVLQA